MFSLRVRAWWRGRALRAKRAEKRDEAVASLVRLGGPAAMSSALRYWKEGNPETRAGALTALLRIGDACVAPALREHLAGPDKWLAATAWALLSRMGNETPPTQLPAALAEDHKLADAIVQVLASVGGPQSTPALICFLSHEAQYVRAHAFDAVGAYGDVRALGVIGAFLDRPRDSHLAVRAIAGIVKHARTMGLDELARIFPTKDSYETEEICEAIVQKLRKSGKSVPTLADDIAGLLSPSHSDQRLILGAISLLGRLQHSRAEKPLLDCLQSDTPAIRLQAILALSKLEGLKNAEPVLSCLGDPSKDIAQAASCLVGAAIGSLEPSTLLRAVGLRPDSKAGRSTYGPLTLAQLAEKELVKRYGAEASPRAISFLACEDEVVVLGAIKVLEEIADGRAAPPLCHCFNHDSERVRIAAISAMRRFKGCHVSLRLWPLLTAEGSAMREAATAAFRGLGHDLPREEVIEPLIDLLADPSADARDVAEHSLRALEGESSVTVAVQRLGALLSAPLPATRRAAAILLRKLGSYGSGGAVELLLSAAADQDARVREAVVASLGCLGGEGVVEALVRALADSDRAVRMAAVGPLDRSGEQKAVPSLIEWLADQDAAVRTEAARVLGRLRAAEAMNLLTGRLEDAVPSVRARAAEALGAIGDARATEPLARCIENDRDRDVRVAAARSLASLLTQHPAALPLSRWRAVKSCLHTDASYEVHEHSDAILPAHYENVEHHDSMSHMSHTDAVLTPFPEPSREALEQGDRNSGGGVDF